MKKSVILPKVDLGQGFRPQPIGLCLNGQPRRPRSLLIPTVQAWQNFYGSTSAACSLALRSSFHRKVSHIFLRSFSNPVERHSKICRILLASSNTLSEILV